LEAARSGQEKPALGFPTFQSAVSESDQHCRLFDRNLSFRVPESQVSLRTAHFRLAGHAFHGKGNSDLLHCTPGSSNVDTESVLAWNIQENYSGFLSLSYIGHYSWDIKKS
jgi:hypothetical protein